eukprot:g4761.t1
MWPRKFEFAIGFKPNERSARQALSFSEEDSFWNVRADGIRDDGETFSQFSAKRVDRSGTLKLLFVGCAPAAKDSIIAFMSTFFMGISIEDCQSIPRCLTGPMLRFQQRTGDALNYHALQMVLQRSLDGKGPAMVIVNEKIFDEVKGEPIRSRIDGQCAVLSVHDWNPSISCNAHILAALVRTGFALQHTGKCGVFHCVNQVGDVHSQCNLVLCPVCLRKLSVLAGSRPDFFAARYQALIKFFNENGMREVSWLRERLISIGVPCEIGLGGENSAPLANNSRLNSDSANYNTLTHAEEHNASQKASLRLLKAKIRRR